MTLTPSGRRALVPIFTIAVVDAIGLGVVMPLFPFYTASLGATAFELGLLYATYSLCSFFAGPWLGRLSDRYGRKRVLMVSQLGTLLSLIVLARAQSLWLVLAARALDGVTAGNMAVVSAAAAEQSTAENRRSALALVSAAMGIGLVIGPALPAVLPGDDLRTPIWFAAALSGLSIGLTQLWFPRAQRASETSTPEVSYRQHLAHRRPRLLVVALGAFFLMSSMYISQFPLVASARYSWHGKPLGPRELGWAFAVAGATNIFVQVIAFRPLERTLRERGVWAAGYGLSIVGFLLLLPGGSVVLFATSVLLVSFGISLVRPTLMAALSLSGPSQHQGALMGLGQAVFGLASVLGPPLAGALVTQRLYVAWALSAVSLLLVALLVGRIAMAPMRAGGSTSQGDC